MTEWITDRNPRIEELTHYMTFHAEDFFVTNDKGTMFQLTFFMSPRNTDGEWVHAEDLEPFHGIIVAWYPFPKPYQIKDDR